MNWYKKAQNANAEVGTTNELPIQQNPSPGRYVGKIPPSLRGLAAEALKYDTFEDFEHAYVGQIKHGRYWHVTDNPNFVIDPEKGPRDMSSMSMDNTGIDKGKLMITSDLPHWVSYYKQGKNPRLYAAEIDMSAVPQDQYLQVNRGFGNEFWVSDPSMARVVRVVPIKNALDIDRRYGKMQPSSSREFEELYYLAHKQNELV
jgi:hypothetical protein